MQNITSGCCIFSLVICLLYRELLEGVLAHDGVVQGIFTDVQRVFAVVVFGDGLSRKHTYRVTKM